MLKGMVQIITIVLEGVKSKEGNVFSVRKHRASKTRE